MAKGGIGFKDSAANYEKLSAEIAAGNVARIYLLMGEEGFFIDRLSERLAEDTLSEEEKAFNRIIAYGRDSDSGVIVNYCRQMPMMGNRQLVIIKEAQTLKKIEQLALYTKSPADSTVLVICHKEKNLDKRTPLYKSIVKNGVVFESVRPRDYEIAGWLTDFIRSRHMTADQKAVAMLTDHLGTDLSKISNELDKLFTALPEGTGRLTAELIEANTGISKDFNNFELTKALSERNMARAMMIAEHFARNPKENPLVVTLGTVFTHFQRIFVINYANWLQKNRGTAMSDAELCGVLKVGSPWFLKEYRQAAAVWPNKKVFGILGYIRQYDMKGKGFGGGAATDGELLRELLLKIFMA